MTIRGLIFACAITVGLAGETLAQGYYPPAPQSKRLGILGGLAGAGIGAAIGEDGGDAVPGAIIGGAIGALSGGTLGRAIDDDEARKRAFYQAQQQQFAQAVTLPDVISMTQAGLGDDVIIAQIRAKGVAQPLTTSDLIVLKQQGVNDRVINAMQFQPPATVVVPPPPVVVRDNYYYRPYHPPAWHYRYPSRPYYYQRPRSSFQFSIGR